METTDDAVFIGAGEGQSRDFHHTQAATSPLPESAASEENCCSEASYDAIDVYSRPQMA